MSKPIANNENRHAGMIVADVLAQHGVRFLYTLCGGHISPILFGADGRGIRVIDVRHEATAVFAADATARLTGIPGVAAVTAGPGLTNTITALKNAQMAQSPVIILGGAVATLLKGRGALQDIDQMALVKPLVKWRKSCKRVRDIEPTLMRAFQIAQQGVPGPVFIELPIDLLYPEQVVRDWTLQLTRGRGIAARLLNLYVRNHLRRTFGDVQNVTISDSKIRAQTPRTPLRASPQAPKQRQLQKVIDALRSAQRPVLLVGSQATLDAEKTSALQQALLSLGIPTYLSGMARGLLGLNELHIRHKRSQALREADLILLAGVPCDFRLAYGQIIPRKATYISINLSRQDLTKNRKPTIGLWADPRTTMCLVAEKWTHDSSQWAGWHQTLCERDTAREAEIAQSAEVETDFINPIWFCQQLGKVLDDDSVLIGDGGDFVASASYIVRPRAPLSWLDPGAFGTLGAGGGFALAAKLVRHTAEVWLLYGDGSCGYSLAEFDTMVRHRVPVIAVIGNDASWAQIAREQVEILGSPLGTELAHTDYHTVVEGYGGVGLCLQEPAQVKETLLQAKEVARGGCPVAINVMIGQTDFRKGSISM
ncbi:thiamine pyrophosphate-binding protein [Chloroflexi bacterium TSY]|nr:thiamine pyrophosphate-binding protein [Chloroflexi bacterium TSY]